jgi:cell division protein FtsW (lipid II flippase)
VWPLERKKKTEGAANVNVQQTTDSHMFARRMAICVAASLVFIVLSLTFASSDLGAVLCFGIALVSVVLLFVFGIARKGRQRLAALLVVMTYVFAAMLLKSNYSLVRDHVRWLFLSGGYKTQVLARPQGEELKHTEWDGWGFAGADTTVFLAFDPTDSLASATEAPPPIKSQALPCEVVRIRRLDRQWYAVLFTPTPIGDKVLASDD